MHELPIIDISALRTFESKNRLRIADELFRACVDKGFFYIVGHGIDPGLERNLEDLSQSFFARPEAEKMRIRMELGGRAWRGYFPLGGELTSGKPDWKEGLYFGKEHSPEDPRVIAGVPLHGANLFPDIEGFADVFIRYMSEMEALGQTLLEGLALSLGLTADYFRQHYTAEPTELFRIFHYPPQAKGQDYWGVGEHTDYGLLTILKQDEVGGLEVKSTDGWISAPPVPNSFVCNIGDMLDRLTGGLFRSTPHRVMNRTARERYSFPYFFDPGFAARLETLPLSSDLRARAKKSSAGERWDRSDVHEVEGTYGDYLLKKVGKVFPELKAKV